MGSKVSIVLISDPVPTSRIDNSPNTNEIFKIEERVVNGSRASTDCTVDGEPKTQLVGDAVAFIGICSSSKYIK